MGLHVEPNDPHPVGPLFVPYQAYPSGLWMLLLLAKLMSLGHIFLSNNLWQENVKVFPSAFWLITRSIIPSLDFLIITFKLSLTDFVMPTQGDHKCVTSSL